MRGWSRREKLEAATAAFFVVFVCGCSPLQTVAPVGQPSAAQAGEVRSGQAEGPVGALEVPYIPAPTSITLCGKPVPLNREPIYERFDKEFTIIVYNHAQVYLWLKRMPRYFPVIEERLRYYGLPDDLKYVAIAESDLLPNACSPKGAAGPWQFMPGTGAEYGLAQSRCVDDRFSFLRSTDSAFMLLKNLHDKYHSWPLALAAYNAGDKRVQDAMREQGVHDYYDLCLPVETERYVFRILAIKAVLSDPGRYGYNLPPQYAYKPFQADRVSVSLPGPVPIRTIARAAGTTFAQIRRLNPALRSNVIPAGTYHIKLPPGTGEAFRHNFRPGAPDFMLAQKQMRSAYARDSESRAAEKGPRVANRSSRPVRAVSHRARRSRIRLAERRHRAAVRESRARKVAWRGVRGRAHAPRAEACRVWHKTRLARAHLLKAKRKCRPARAVHHKVKGHAVHRKPRLRGAKREEGRRLARR